MRTTYNIGLRQLVRIPLKAAINIIRTKREQLCSCEYVTEIWNITKY